MTDLSLFRDAMSARLAASWDDATSPAARRLAAMRAAPTSLIATLKSSGIGSAEKGQELLTGKISTDGRQADFSDDGFWDVRAQTAGWALTVQGFDWLGDLSALGGGPAQRLARTIAMDWLDKGASRASAWWPQVLARRLRNLLTHTATATHGVEETTLSRWLVSLGVQARYLNNRWSRAPEGPLRLEAASGLVAAGLCLEGLQHLVPAGVDAIRQELAAQISPGGAHVSRNPEYLLKVLETLVVVRSELREAGHELAGALDEPIGRIAPAMRMMRHGDGGLAMFNGGDVCTDGRVDSALFEASVRTRAPDQVGGYARISSGRSVAIFDVGAPPEGGYASAAHAGTLALEFSHGRRRLVVNCGSGERFGKDWASASRETAAHSTLTVDGVSSARFLSKGFASRSLGRRLVDAPSPPDVERTDDLDGAWILARHDGYLLSHGLIHERRLFLSPDGYDLRGEDTVTAESGASRATYFAALDGREGLPFSIRFHLHPDVEARMILADNAVSMSLPSGDTWLMRQSGGVLSIEESVYLANDSDGNHQQRATNQIVVRGETSEYSGRVVWMIKRADPLRAAVRDVTVDNPV